MADKGSHLVAIVSALVAEPLGDQLKQIRELRREVDQLKREMTLIKLHQGSSVRMRKVRMSNE